MKDVPMELSREEFVGRMVERNMSIFAASRGVPINSRIVQIKLSREECVSLTALRQNDATSRGVPMEPQREEFVSRMEQR